MQNSNTNETTQTQANEAAIYQTLRAARHAADTARAATYTLEKNIFNLARTAGVQLSTRRPDLAVLPRSKYRAAIEKLGTEYFAELTGKSIYSLQGLDTFYYFHEHTNDLLRKGEALSSTVTEAALEAAASGLSTFLMANEITTPIGDTETRAHLSKVLSEIANDITAAATVNE